MKYSYPETINHPLSVERPECLEIFNALILSEGYDGTTIVFDNNIVVINMDCIESKKAYEESSPRNKSMDCSFAIEDKESQEVQMLLVELRFNYINMQNLTKQELVGKVNGSISILNRYPLVINNEYIFVFKSDLKEQARSRLFRMYPRIPNHYVVMDIYELKNKYF